MPDRLSEDMPGRMPEDMPDRISNRMPNRMPEDFATQNVRWHSIGDHSKQSNFCLALLADSSLFD